MDNSEIVENGVVEKTPTTITTDEEISKVVVTNGDIVPEPVDINVQVDQSNDEIVTESQVINDNDIKTAEITEGPPILFKFQLGPEANIETELEVNATVPEVAVAPTIEFEPTVEEVKGEIKEEVKNDEKPIEEPVVESEPIVTTSVETKFDEPEPDQTEPIEPEVKTATIEITNGIGVSGAPIKVLEVSASGAFSINTEYLTIIADGLKSNGFQPGYSIEIKNPGEGALADMVRISVTGAQTIDGKTCNSVTSLILKTLPDSSADQQAQFSAISTFEREVLMYTKVLPAFMDFQKYKEIPYELGFYNTPYCYAAVCDPAKNLYVIVLEDLVERGYKMWDKLKPVDYDHMKLGLTRLARFHAISMAMNEQNPDIFQDLCKLEDNFYKGMMTEPEKFTPIINFSITHAIESLNNQEEFKIDKIIELQKNIVQNFGNWIGPQNASSFKVINHGDCWINNTMYAYYAVSVQIFRKIISCYILNGGIDFSFAIGWRSN